MLRYHRQVEDYIYEIEIPSNAFNNENTLECIDKANAEYRADKYIIRNIIHIPTKRIQKGLCLDVCDYLYNYSITYYLTYERAVAETSFEWLRKNGVTSRQDFSNVFTSYYDNGQVYNSFFHINGILQGLYTQYTYDGNIQCQCTFLNGRIHGECLVYNYDVECHCCGDDKCKMKKHCYTYFFDNGNRLNTDDYFMDNELDIYIIPYHLQSK
jgi:hypothetical protein